MKLTTQEWEGNAVAFRTDDAYASLTLLCAPFEKRPNDFLSLASTTAFVEALCQAEGKPREELVITRNGGNTRNPGSDPTVTRNPGNGAQGTWAHPDLALECARWLDPAFAIWCNRVIRGILNGSIKVDADELPPPPAVETALPPVDEEQEDDEEEQAPKEFDVPRETVMAYCANGAGWPAEFRVALGKRVKNLALAFGVPVRRVPCRNYGALFAWPEDLYNYAMSDMHQDPEWDYIFRPHQRPRKGGARRYAKR